MQPAGGTMKNMNILIRYSIVKIIEIIYE